MIKNVLMAILLSIIGLLSLVILLPLIIFISIIFVISGAAFVTFVFLFEIVKYIVYSVHVVVFRRDV